MKLKVAEHAVQNHLNGAAAALNKRKLRLQSDKLIIAMNRKAKKSTVFSSFLLWYCKGRPFVPNYFMESCKYKPLENYNGMIVI